MENSKDGSAAEAQSYSRILRSSSIIGGAAGINYVVSLIRTKIIAVLLGPAGVGLVGMYTQISGTIGTLAGLGIGASGVRQIAESDGSGDQVRMATTVKTLRRVCWVTGLLGWILAACLALPLSEWIFNDPKHAWAISVLGATVLFGAVSGGQNALIQGIRRIGDLAKIQVIGALASTLAAIGLYFWLHERGIVPVLITSAAIHLAISWWFARKIQPRQYQLGIRETLSHAKGLISLGLAFMWSALLTGLVLLAIRAVIIRDFGIEANGVYQAAWGISGLFAGIILKAMGADFYPRLTAASASDVEVNRLVNEQTEIGILLALPGLVWTLAYAPWLMKIFYSSEFVTGAELLPWFVLGIFGQVISWPLGFIMLAKGAKIWFAASETIGNFLRLFLSIWLLKELGLIGSAMAIPILYATYILILLFAASILTRFRWSAQVGRLFAICGMFVFAGFLIQNTFAESLALVVGSGLTVGSIIYSGRGLLQRLDADHAVIKVIRGIPGARLILGV